MTAPGEIVAKTWFDFDPEHDITIAEIAEIFKAMQVAVDERVFWQMPEEVQRHFTLRSTAGKDCELHT